MNLDEKAKKLWESCSSYIPGMSGFVFTHEEWCIQQFKAFAREVRLEAMEEAARALPAHPHLAAGIRALAEKETV